MNGNNTHRSDSRSTQKNGEERAKRTWSFSQVFLGLSLMANYWLLLSTSASTQWSVVSAPEEAMLVPQLHLVNVTSSVRLETTPTTGASNEQSTEASRSLDALVKSNATSEVLGAPTGEAPPRLNDTVNVMFGLKGASSALVDEWSVAMKSILLNAPLDANLHIHIIADEVALKAVKARIRRQFGIEHSRWRHQITITLYNVEKRIQEWAAFIRKAIRANNEMDRRVTMGGYFRLLAYKVLPASVGSVIYLDPDVVIMTNLNEIWKYMDSEKVLQLATRWPCSGFMILNMAKFQRFWDGLDSLPNITHGGDQSLVVEFIKQFPDEIGNLPEQWDGHLGHGFKHAAHKIISKRRYGVGFLHFQGERPVGQPYYGNGSLKQCAYTCNATSSARSDYRRTWGLADYYVQVTWEWLKYYGKSSITHGHSGYPLRFEIN